MAVAFSLVITGSATIISPSTEVANSTPLRSTIAPRSAGRSTVCTPSRAAIAAYAFGSRPCSLSSRTPNRDRTMAITTKPKRNRNSADPRVGSGRGLNGCSGLRGRWVTHFYLRSRPGCSQRAGSADSWPAPG